jgi:hypothetical protein
MEVSQLGLFDLSIMSASLSERRAFRIMPLTWYSLPRWVAGKFRDSVRSADAGEV